MNPTVHAVLMVTMRWIHIASAILLLGGFAFARFVLAPELTGAASADVADRAAARFRPILLTVVVTILGSGLYNYLSRSNYPPHYHMWMGIKLLLVLHVLAAALLYAGKSVNAAKRQRQAMGIVISGAVILLISGWLRYLSLTPVVKLP
jgi:uncharacterized membrane protein